MTRQKALAILTARVPDENSTPDDRAAFLTALHQIAAEKDETLEIAQACFRELQSIGELDVARSKTERLLAAALRS